MSLEDEPKFVVVWGVVGEFWSIWTRCRVFWDKDSAAKYALRVDGTIYGLNPRYEFTAEFKEVE